MASISSCAKADEADIVGQLTPVIGVGDEEDIVAELIEWPRLKASHVEYPTGSSRFREFCKAKSSIDGISGHAFAYSGRVWNDNLLWLSGESLQRSDEEPVAHFYEGINCKVLRKESFIDIVVREGTEVEAILKELEINRFKRVASKNDKVRRLQTKGRLAGKTPEGCKKGAASCSVTPVSVDDSSKRRKVTSPTKSQEVLEESDKIAEGADLRPRFEVEAGLLEEQCRAKAREKMVAVMDDEFKKLEREKEREAAALKLKEVRANSEAEAERLVTASAISWNNLAGKLYQLRYTKAKIMAFSQGNYEEMEIMGEDKVEEREDGLNVAEKTVADNQETITQLSLKLKEAKRQVEEKTTIILSRDLALNQLTSELAELKEKAASGSRHENRVKADLRHLKGREAKSRSDVAEIQAENKSFVDDLAHARGNVRRVVQREKEMNERINQLCARISESERELRVREMKYQKDLKFELDKRDGEIASGEGSREMKKFLRRKE
ncbi:hypothetical protein GIB67_005823 [Kingdonia uniflora]|uniref:Uncharacterized protein n=1 Tax=Kingdonia uniflora TaxID=39325 RepID=A0A7J7LU44_9MAGN|nr:hypothetical protein GIB67_005823 [Kingdonia uniflora]